MATFLTAIGGAMWTLAGVFVAIYAVDRATAQGVSPWENGWFLAAVVLASLGFACFVIAFVLTVRARRRDREQKDQTRAPALVQPRQDVAQTKFAHLGAGGRGNRFSRILAEVPGTFVVSGGPLDDTTFEDIKSFESVPASGGPPIILPKEQLPQLRYGCSNLAQELRAFLYERQRLEPMGPHYSRNDSEEALNKKSQDYGERIVAHHNETMYLYEDLFGDRVRFAAKLAADNGYPDDRLSLYAQEPVNTSQLGRIAGMLGVISERIGHDLDR
jgi:hypothetical protein